MLQGLRFCCSFCLVLFFYLCLANTSYHTDFNSNAFFSPNPSLTILCNVTLLFLSHFITSPCLIFFTLGNYCMSLCTRSFCFTHVNTSSVGTILYVSPEPEERLAYRKCSHTFAEGRYDTAFHREAPYEEMRESVLYSLRGMNMVDWVDQQMLHKEMEIGIWIMLSNDQLCGWAS